MVGTWQRNPVKPWLRKNEREQEGEEEPQYSL
jgi:hypothetical protein